MSTLSSFEVDELFEDFETQREALVGRDAMQAIGYKCLHHSQAFAVLNAIKQVCHTPS